MDWCVVVSETLCSIMAAEIIVCLGSLGGESNKGKLLCWKLDEATIVMMMKLTVTVTNGSKSKVL